MKIKQTYFKTIWLAGLAILCAVALVGCGDQSTSSKLPATLAECYASNWDTTTVTWDKTPTGQVCDSLLFMDFMKDCEWLDTARSMTTGRNHWMEGDQWFAYLKKLSPKIAKIRWVGEIHMFIEGNEVNQLPIELWHMPHLAMLDITVNDSLSSFADIDTCPTLKYLTILGSFSGSFPKGLEKCQDLKELSVTYTGLTQIPEGIKNLPNLWWVDLHNNKIDTLPDWLPQMPALKHLDLSYNQIRTLPENIGELSDHASLNLNDNRLHQLPASFCAFSPLSYDINNNPFCDLPDSISRCLQEGYQTVTPCSKESL